MIQQMQSRRSAQWGKRETRAMESGIFQERQNSVEYSFEIADEDCKVTNGSVNLEVIVNLMSSWQELCERCGDENLSGEGWGEDGKEEVEISYT